MFGSNRCTCAVLPFVLHLHQWIFEHGFICSFRLKFCRSKQCATNECNMHHSSQPQFHADTMHSNPALMPAQTATHPRTGGYGPVGQTINRMQQHSQPQSLQLQPFPPPPPPPRLPSPPPGTFSQTKPTGPPLPALPSPSPSPTSTQTTPSPPQPLRNKPQTLPPADFTPSPTHWDTRSVFGLDLPRFIKHTPHTEANHTAGMPITDLTILQTVCHGWNSYWLRYMAHGYNTGVFFTKHISETMFASEFFSGLRAKKIDLDATAIAYCHQRNIPAPTKQKALSALVSEFVEYMQDVNNGSNPAPSKAPQRNTQGPQLKIPQQPDPATAQRLLTLEHQLATANLTISHLRGQPTPLPSQPTIIHTQPTPNMNTHPDSVKSTSADISPIAPRNLQPHLDSLMPESTHHPNPTHGDSNLHSQVVDITSSPVPAHPRKLPCIHRHHNTKMTIPSQLRYIHTTQLTQPHPLTPIRCHNHTNIPQPQLYADTTRATQMEPARLPNPSPQIHPKSKENAPYNLAATPPCSKTETIHFTRRSDT